MDLLSWRNDRHEIIMLKQKIDDVFAKHDDLFREANTDLDRLKVVASIKVDTKPYVDRIEHIRSARLLETANRLLITIPENDAMGDAKNWFWSPEIERFILTRSYQQQLRREIALERELAYKPWLSWMAIGISILGLLVAIFRK